MNASETKLQPIIEGQKQYVVPLFQRRYTWDTLHWNTLWSDLLELCEDDAETSEGREPRHHFFGSIVTMPAQSVPEGVTKYTLIDGQQRLTTILILLAAIRDEARDKLGVLAPEIDQTLLTNPFKSGTDNLKLLPTQVQGDREAFTKIILDSAASSGGATTAMPETESNIPRAHKFFQKKLRAAASPALETLKRVVVSNLVLVSIVLDPKSDNPFLIFESLNAKGERLSQADLIRNYFFMRMPIGEQEQIYHALWEPMEKQLSDDLSECIRHFLMKDGTTVRKGDVYVVLKERADSKTSSENREYLRELARFGAYFSRLLRPQEEPDTDLRERLQRLNRIEVTVAYPLLLNIYDEYDANRLSKEDFVAILDVLECFMIRRFVCGVPTYGLNKIFPPLYSQAAAYGSVVEGVKETLRTKNYPRDSEFRDRLQNAPLYGQGDRLPKVKLLLERLEASFGHHEIVPFDNLTIEHVMPQTLTPQWQAHLGENFGAVHDLLLHTLGNLSLTAYNSPLSNFDFPTKRQILKESHLEINKPFGELEAWDEAAIRHRAETLAVRALDIWKDFAPARDDTGTQHSEVTGTTPH